MASERSFPPDPIAAVTFPDPYPFYTDLVARGLYRDEALGLWIAASAEAVTAVLKSDLCRVRPPAEPVPRALVGSPAGEIFRHLVRMNDGPVHDSCRQAVSAMLGTIDETQAAAASRHWAGFLANELPGFQFRLPVYTVASLLRVPPDSLRSAAEWMGDLAPGSGAGQHPRTNRTGTGGGTRSVGDVPLALRRGCNRGQRDRTALPGPRRDGRPDRQHARSAGEAS